MHSPLNAEPLGCGHGFMSELRMKVLLGLETLTLRPIGVVTQLITPDMRFTCNGMITKWIIAATVSRDEPRTAELQLWRNTTNGVYEKINGTQINITTTKSSRGVFEFDNFSPIPFQAGDILGLYLPRTNSIRFYSEDTNSTINYFIIEHAESYDTIDTTSVRSSFYHPMVSIEISELGTSIVLVGSM